MNLVKKENKVIATCTVKNSGAREGSEVVQLYVHDKESSVDRPLKELKGFEKISLKPRESKSVTIELDETAFSFYHPQQLKWVLEPGVFDIEIGNSSRDIKLTKEITL